MKDIWGCGQGIGAIDKRMSTQEFVDKLVREYDEARAALAKRQAFGVAPVAAE